MSETANLLFMISLTVCVLYGTFRITGWKMKKACNLIIRDLKEKKAFDPASAVELPYSKAAVFNLGMRDYRPRALEQLVKLDMVRLLEGGRYYLRDAHQRGIGEAGPAQ
jgi:hypothetical protein